ncbi:Hint domain-containing protein [Sagittula sp. SSi028]|uniref:Hint domain-containing protein n=1 Tax=Sagittula sp. SSi028 TaxID=3400636 RepID=UPI003AF9B4B6
MQYDKPPQPAGGLPARHLAPDQALNALPLGTNILTLDGVLPVEYLTPGDRVITRTSGAAKLVGLRPFRRVTATVGIAAGTLGNQRPEQDAVLCAAQEILVRDWRASALFGASQALVPVARLIDGTFVRALGLQELKLFELVFEHPQIVYADGLELASGAIARAPA